MPDQCDAVLFHFAGAKAVLSALRGQYYDYPRSEDAGMVVHWESIASNFSSEKFLSRSLDSVSSRFLSR